MALWFWNERRNFLGCFSLMSVVGNIFVAVGACVFGIVTRSGFLVSLDFLDFLVYLELLEEVGVLV